MLPFLTSRSKSLCHLLSQCFHWESVTMRRTMESYDELPLACLGGIDGLTKSMNASINLANEAHYDCNDLGVGMSVWMEQVQDHPTDSYFVLPNLLVMDNKKQTRSGVLKLCDGCAISWDGALIKHCTSIRTSSDYQFNQNAKLGDFYSFNVVHNGKNLAEMERIRDLQYQEYMGDNNGVKNLNDFAMHITDNGVREFW